MPYKTLNLIIIASAVYILKLALDNKLSLYIHPRYIVFTVIMTIIGLMLAIVGFYSSRAKLPTKGLLGLLPLMMIVLLGLVLPPRSLTSFSVAQRTTSVDSTASGGNQTLSYYSGSSKNLNIAEWSRLISSNSEPAFYVNRQVDVSGFVYDTGRTDSFQIARFVVTCCTVDAQPTGLTVYKPGWRSQYSQDEWLRLTGKIIENPDASASGLVIQPESIKKINEPDNPYAN